VQEVGLQAGHLGPPSGTSAADSSPHRQAGLGAKALPPPEVQEQLLQRLELLDARLARMEKMQLLNTVQYTVQYFGPSCFVFAACCSLAIEAWCLFECPSGCRVKVAPCGQTCCMWRSC